METEITTRSTGIRYGLILGLISFIYFLAMNMVGMDTNQGWARWAGLVLNFGILVLSHLYFRENGSGYMSFSEGLGISFWLGLIAGLIVVTGSLGYIQFVDTEYMQRMSDIQRQAMEDQGLTDEQIDQGMAVAARFTSPGFFFVFGLIGNIIVMVLMGLLVTLFTQRPDTRMPE